MKIDWQRVKRTMIQSVSGALIALITTISSNITKETIVTASVTCLSTILIALFMNLKSQAEEEMERRQDRK